MSSMHWTGFCEGTIVLTIVINELLKKISILAPASSTHFSWSFKLGTFIMVNVIDALEILRRGYRVNNCY